MLRALRAERFARFLLLAAALLAVSGSFGLHPEPGGNAAGTPADIRDAGLWTPASIDVADADVCLACLAHRSVSLSALCVFTPTAARVIGAPDARAARPLSLYNPRLDDGRAPPPLA